DCKVMITSTNKRNYKDTHDLISDPSI
ncbi:hypothetical protein BVRB_005550, partial [Beta vulgaris subsp. vulgaris]